MRALYGEPGGYLSRNVTVEMSVRCILMRSTFRRMRAPSQFLSKKKANSSMSIQRTFALLSAAVVLSSLVACDDKTTPAGSATAAATTKPASSVSSAKPTATATATATAAASASAAPAAGEKKEISAEDLQKLFKAPEGSTSQKVAGMDGFLFNGPKDVKLAGVGTPGKKKWGTTTFGGLTMATLLVNHEQDEGEKCMKLADAKTKIGDAKIVKESLYTVPVVDKAGKHADFGDEAAELLVFEKDGKQGFYAHKVFDHGDDATHVCCTAGAAADAPALKGTAEAEKIDQMAGVCMSWSFNF